MGDSYGVTLVVLYEAIYIVREKVLIYFEWRLSKSRF